MDSLTETLLWLCEIPSPIGDEAEICTAVERRVGKVRLAGAVRRYGNSIVVPLTRGTGGPHVALVGHLDVVRTDHDAPPRIEGDKLYGPGASDMKSGLALMLDLAEQSARPNVDLTLVFYAREEGPFVENELGPVLDQDPELRAVSIAVCLEPSDNRLQLGCAGSLHGNVQFHGRTSHSARPWQGENAIHKAAPFLTRLAALTPQKSQLDGLEWSAVTSATLAKAGRARNIIPDLFEVNVNHRFGPDRTLEQAKAHLIELASPEGEVVFVDEAPPALPFRKHPLVEALAASGVVSVEPKQAWTDVARFSALGVPAVNFGPGVNSQAHQRNEWTSLGLLAGGRDILMRWLGAIAK
ncbi:MAG TPA: succinyl-diaminopimelate desuccinylase [Polyangiaceae bacterium]|jgi:succinyl-diaminopimelate desuccinylase|nr:succinyl-diaminopimelate desuccinylase [Polyangiaceae bacterium]